MQNEQCQEMVQADDQKWITVTSNGDWETHTVRLGGGCVCACMCMCAPVCMCVCVRLCGVCLKCLCVNVNVVRLTQCALSYRR